MDETGHLFGWAFGDKAKAGTPGYLQAVEAAALENARQYAASRGLEAEPGTEHYAIVEQGETLIDVDAAPGGLIVRCTVTVTGPGAAGIHPEGPMNG